MTRSSKTRQEMFRKQSGKCFYCEQPMWETDIQHFACHHGLSLSMARWLKSTIEHLHAKCEGGGNGRDNLVAACHFCNAHRHRARRPKSSTEFARFVRKRLRRDRWHGIRLNPVGQMAEIAKLRSSALFSAASGRKPVPTPVG